MLRLRNALLQYHSFTKQMKVNNRYNPHPTSRRFLSHSLSSPSRYAAYVAPTEYDDESELEAAFKSLNSVKLQGMFTGPDAETLDSMLKLVSSKLVDVPHLYRSKYLSRLNIEDHGFINLKSNFRTRAAMIDTLGMAEHWSSDGFYRHLNILRGLILHPKEHEDAARTWVDAFYFRAAAMLPLGKKLVLSPEQFTSAANLTACSAITANEKDIPAFLDLSIHRSFRKDDHTLFVAGIRPKDVPFHAHIPDVVHEMYACVRNFGVDTVRGALTDGHDWIFIILKMNPNGNGGAYAYSEKVRLMTTDFWFPDSERISRTMCATITGIITHWIINSNKDIGDDDWFTRSAV